MIAIIEYNAGNIRSVANALHRLGYESSVTGDHDKIRSAEKVIFPGVGEASGAMHYLRNEGLDKLLVSLRQPVLGICLGLQLMCRYSDEGNTEGLGIFDADVLLFPPLARVPHMGWNTAQVCREHPLVADWDEESRFYFVHSFHVVAKDMDAVLAKTDYGVTIHSILGRENIMGVQFHPEKSHRYGMRLLKNFAENIK